LTVECCIVWHYFLFSYLISSSITFLFPKKIELMYISTFDSSNILLITFSIIPHINFSAFNSITIQLFACSFQFIFRAYKLSNCPRIVAPPKASRGIFNLWGVSATSYNREAKSFATSFGDMID
jgi:hypothetical protein